MSVEMLEQEERKVLDQKRAEAFAGKMLGVINSAALALMTSIGHRTRLFDVMAICRPRRAWRSRRRRICRSDTCASGSARW